MGRTAITMFALAALAVSAHGVPVTPAHAHTKSGGVQALHHAPAHRHSANASPHPHEKATALSHSTKPSSSTRLSTRHAAEPAHKPTPEEVGRAAGLKIRNELDRRAEMRHSYSLRHHPALIQARYTTVRPARSVEASLTENNLDTQASSQSESASMSGTTQYQAVDAEAESSKSTIADPARMQPSAISETSDSESSDSNPAPPAPARPITNARRNQSTRSAVTSAESDETDSTVADAAPTASRNAAHPSFASHAEVGPPVSAMAPNVGTDDRAVAKNEPAGENTDAYDISEDTRLKAETEQASLTIASGYMPAPLRGNRASLERQNERLAAEGLERIEDEDDLASRIAHHLLVPVPASEALIVNGNLPVNHRYCRPWTARFISDLASAHQAEFHRPLEVSSAVRTVDYQKRLMLVNGNAAPAEGDVVSPHLTGAAIDIAKDNLSRAEMAWMRRHLLAIEAAGKIDVEEEFQQSCFHITVYKNYMPAYHGSPRRGQTPSEARSRKGRAVHTEVADGASTQGF
jgi:hypothetical protein